MMTRIAASMLVVTLSFLVSAAHAAIVADYSFDHLSDPNAGFSEGQQLEDARRTEDESGNRYHGFYGGGAGNTAHVTFNTPTGTAGIDFSQNGTGTVILRDGLVDGGAGSPNPWYGGGATPSPFFSVGATESWTIETLVNFQTAGAFEAIIANNGGSGTPEWWWRTDATGDGLQFLFEDGSGNVVIDAHASTAVGDDLWHHAALVFDRDPDSDGIDADDGEVRTYIDNVLLGTTTFDPTLIGAIGDGARDIEIGQFDGTTARDFDGFIDRLVISNAALDPGSFVIQSPVPEPTSVLMCALLGILALNSRARSFHRRNR